MAPRLRLSPPKKERRSSSSLFFDDGSFSPLRLEKRNKVLNFTIGQATAILAIVVSIAATLTAFISAHSLASTVSAFMVENLIVPASPSSTGRQLTPAVRTPHVSTKAVKQLIHDDHPRPGIIWLMSFPNSGTSFTIHMTREATNCTTATNYGLEGEIRDKPSVQAIQGQAGINGPWLELIPERHTRIAHMILTKTHCKAFCSGAYCGPEKTFHTVRSFMMGCLTGNQGIETPEKGLHLVDKTYDKELVKKAIHIFRHPLDNVVARFHLEFNEKRDAGDTKYTSLFPKNATGFHRWCALDDRNRGLVRSSFVDRKLRTLMLDIPCFNEFYRYGQWHNLAFATSAAMNVTTMILHYHEYSQDFPKARAKVLDFLELPRVGEGFQFHDGKVYRNYYSLAQRKVIRTFLQELSIAETWEQLKDYDFETNTSPEPGSIDIELK